jgi:SnoaL-like protein
MDPAGFEDWLGRYFDAWVSNDPADVASLFTEDAIYRVGPFREPWVGRDQIVDRWTSGILTIAFAPDGRCREHREWFSQREIP